MLTADALGAYLVSLIVGIQMNLSDRREFLVRVVSLSLVVPAIAVALGLLTPWFGLLAAAALFVQGILGHLLGRVLDSWLRTGRREFLFWTAWSVGMGVVAGIGVTKVWGITASVLFGLFLSILLISIGYCGSRQIKRGRKNEA